MKRCLAIIACCLLVLPLLLAARARGRWHRLSADDGTPVDVRLTGDEHWHYYQDANGTCYCEDAAMGRLLPQTRLQMQARRAVANATAQQRRSKLPQPSTTWDALRTYRQAVLLVAFSDQDFRMDDPKAYYERLFNERGFNEGRGKGCVAEYFADQSAGLFRPQFDVYGPITISKKAADNGNYGTSAFRIAAQQWAAEVDADFSDYDWNGNGQMNQLIVVYAGYGANDEGAASKGCIWPNTSSFASVRVGNVRVSAYSASPERWIDDTRCGLGTICHEYSHCLGLPDFYPTTSSSGETIVVDEWDLMDGGNYTDDGWCPCNYSIHEKMLLGWATPEELTSEATISDLRPLASGGQTYRIANSGNNAECYLLENRQHEGWDRCTPGHGLVVWHVDYLQSRWTGNTVNNDASHHRMDLIHADNRNYEQSEANAKAQKQPRTDGASPYLRYTPYPCADSERPNDALTDTSTPAATLFSDNTEGTQLMGQPVTDITEAADGTVSFRFMAPASRLFAPVADGGQTGRRPTLVPLDAKRRLQLWKGKKTIVQATH